MASKTIRATNHANARLPPKVRKPEYTVNGRLTVKTALLQIVGGDKLIIPFC